MISTGFIACADFAEAKKIASALLDKRLIACANIAPEIHSFYWWKGKREEAKEALLIVKTRKKHARKIFAEVKKLHSYELPSMEFFEAETGRENEKWIKKETK
ncbi:MAG: divalent-cation tolerance protein CutA [Candidatus ainarchaeum sp.]|nr:divalent-cation tolerance protein CutA [Candidatus ainarchaeum sp.]